MEQLKEMLAKFQETFEGLDRNKKLMAAGGAGAVVVVILILSLSGGGETDVRYLPLYTELDMKEVGQLTTRLQEMNQDFTLGGDGTIILVPEEDRLRLRASLAADGFPKTGLIGYEVFEETPLGMTEFLQQVKFQQALEGELKRTLLELEQVEDVRLHVVMPEPSLFTDQQQPATASIMLKLRPRMNLDQSQIEGIQRLVASSVEGLEFENITVVDNAGNLLSEEIDPLARLTSKQIEVQRNVEAYLEARAQSAMDHVLGPDQALVKVTVDMNFDQREETIETYDPASSVLRSEESTEESSAEAGTKERRTSNWEVNRSIQRITGSVGSIRRISVSLTVNARVPVAPPEGETEVQWRTRTPQEMEDVAKVARGSLGLDETRGDLLAISSFEFAVTDIRAQEELRRQKEERDELITSIVLNVAKAIAIVIALLVLRAIIGAIGRGVAREEEIAMEAQRELEEEEVAEELPETPHELLLGRIAQLITERPEDAAKLIRTMLIEDEQQRQRQGG